MARILRSETSLGRWQETIARELSRSRVVRPVVWAVMLAILAASVAHFFSHHSYGSLLAGAVAVVLAVGYEVHLREIAREEHHLEGGRRGEQKIADLFAEQLADSHVILNDLEFRIGHQRCQIDHLILAPSGIYVIESKFWAGTLSGDVRDTQWTQTRSNGKTQLVKSPVLQVERQRSLFISGLTAKVPEDRIYALAVFSHRYVNLRITNGQGRVFRIRDAIKFINDHCFDPPVLTEAAIMELADRINRSQA